MITTLEASGLISRIRRRIEDPSGNAFGDGEILDAVHSALMPLHTKLRLENKMHDTDVLAVAISSLTAVAGLLNTYDYTVPETAGEVVQIKGLRSSGRISDLFNKVPPQLIEVAVGHPAWHWYGARPGTLRIMGRLDMYQQLAIWYTRQWPPLHHGTAAGGGAATITFAAAPTAGTVVLRDDVYIGVDVLLTNNLPAGVQTQMARVTDYDGATRVATVSPAWGTAPDGTTTYGLVPPIGGEYFELLIEESAQILKEELGEGLPLSPRLVMLRDLFEQGLSQRDGEPPRRLWNRGI